MGSFVYRLELEDGTPADPPTLRTAVPNWSAGDTIPLGHGRTPRRRYPVWNGTGRRAGPSSGNCLDLRYRLSHAERASTTCRPRGLCPTDSIRSAVSASTSRMPRAEARQT